MAKLKVCVVCGEDCSGRPRTKDLRGHYYCLAYYQQARHKPKRAGDTSAPVSEADSNPLLGDPPESIASSMPAPPPSHAQVEPHRSKRPSSLSGLLGAHLRIGLPLFAISFIAVIALSDWVTALFILFVAWITFNGYWIGATKIAALFGGLLAGALLGAPVGKAMEDLCSTVFNTTGTTNRMVSVALCALIIVIVVTAILKVLIGRWVTSKHSLNRYDRLIGSGLGLLEGVLLGFLLLWTLLSLEPIAVTSLAQTETVSGTGEPNPISRQIVNFAHTARESTVGWLADTFNPLDDIRQLTLLANGLIVLNDPDARKAFISHPAIENIQQYESVQEALRRLGDDAEISQVLESGTTAEIISTVLASPTLLDIFDQTNILADLSPLTDEIERAINEAMEDRTK